VQGEIAGAGGTSGVGIGKRIEELRRQRRWSRRDLAAEAGVSRQYIGEIEKGLKTNPGAGVLERIAQALGWESYHLMEESADEVEAEGEPSYVGAWGPLRRGQIVPVVAGPDEAFVRVPVVGTASAGVGIGSTGRIEDYVHVLKKEARGKELLAVRVRGECMVPVLFPGDVVIYEVVHGQDEVQSGALCVVTDLDEAGEGDGGNVKYVDWIADLARLRAEDKKTPEKMLPRDRVKVDGLVWRMIREF
jgi:SOS-response transcriptional repressor LexA